MKTISLAFEWLQENYVRQVIVEIPPGSLIVRKPRGGLLRKLIFPENAQIIVYHSEPNASGIHGPYCLIKLSNTHDLVVRLPSDKHLPDFLAALTFSLKKLDGHISCVPTRNQLLLNKAETKDRRQQRLDHFFREAYARAFDQPKLSDVDNQVNDTDDILNQTITRNELAQAIGMRETDMFVQRMFAITSHSSSDVVTFAEFLEVLKKFNEGSIKDKYKLLFAMCDVNGRGRVRRSEFAELIRSLNAVVGVSITESSQDHVIENILYRSGINPTSEYLTAADFESIFSQVDERRPIGVDFRGAKIKVNLQETASLKSFALSSTSDRHCLPQNVFASFAAYVETYRQHISILFIFCCINIMVFLERFWHYRYETEHRDLRRVMGAGIAITRGAAGALSFCMAVVLLTVCRNVITVVRETPLGEFIPFDSAITFHKDEALYRSENNLLLEIINSAFKNFTYRSNFLPSISYWFYGTITGLTGILLVAVMSIIYVFALPCFMKRAYHAFRVHLFEDEALYRSENNLLLKIINSAFKNFTYRSNFLPSISYWFYGTITGLTGILLVAVMSIIYVFALPCFMKRAYHAFRLTHLLNVAFYALTILHGLPKLLDSPKFLYYAIGPVIIFVIDRIMGMRQEYKKLRILNAELLPSDIIYLQFKRPLSFSFRSGQWVRISSPAFSCAFNECHAFSLASAPQSPTLELYIKAVGPWTWKLRSEIIRAQASGSPYPLVHMNGPYGDGNQEWTNYEVAILIGGGIGVTPYASTLTDLVLETTSGRHHNIKCKKVYFLWICPTHKNYEWFVDVLKDVEELDQNKLIETHIFVTQFFHKFDLRTTMLYICEKHFRGDHQGKSMFTGLRAHNHFGRPNFDTFFSYIQNVHNEMSDIGVFSCGPSTLNDQINSACARANRTRNAPSLMHRFETF
ncbi:FAD-binding domain protein [Dictyocaulus viviparus]|uniref:NAD(P)H oxidase (H2O2-forming) n=1 Tax=Dictyocaulus viviparus TaxID=29172 RepID=A0A0D8XVJ5_DICVI|nr:FAD-binding domain protein [Dictyocaulus viviparus]